jgi:hypothetical protein
MNDPDLARLRSESRLATKFWGRTFSALNAVTYREKGADAAYRLYIEFLSRHQSTHFRDGLEKIGVSPDEPPAVMAAKYHYLSNILGGLELEYAEESPKKVWIRYTAPMWTYAGVAMMTFPAEYRAAAFVGWHPANGRMLGNKRLGWVSTKYIMEGEPYDEGYFIEYDHDITPEQAMRREVVWKTPRFDPDRAPQLDPVLWPEARRLKARRKYSRGYVRETVESMFSLFGEQATLFIVSQAMKLLAIQYTHEFRQDLGITGNGVEDVVTLLASLLRACEQDFSTASGPAGHTITLSSFKPFDDAAPEALRACLFHFQEMVARLTSGQIEAARSRVPAGGTEETWCFRDTGRWLW